jgi:hypothetical protein
MNGKVILRNGIPGQSDPASICATYLQIPKVSTPVKLGGPVLETGAENQLIVASEQSAALSLFRSSAFLCASADGLQPLDAQRIPAA